MVSEIPKMVVLWIFATKSKLKASLAVWRNFLPYIFQGGLQPGSPSRRAAPEYNYKKLNAAANISFFRSMLLCIETEQIDNSEKIQSQLTTSGRCLSDVHENMAEFWHLQTVEINKHKQLTWSVPSDQLLLYYKYLQRKAKQHYKNQNKFSQRGDVNFVWTWFEVNKRLKCQRTKYFSKLKKSTCRAVNKILNKVHHSKCRNTRTRSATPPQKCTATKKHKQVTSSSNSNSLNLQPQLEV